MSIILRIILIIGAISLFFFMVKKIRQSKMKIEHTIFWLIFSVVLVVMGLFPQIVYVISKWLGFQAPVNMVFLVIIFILILKNFFATLQISHLENKIDNLVQAVAIDKKIHKCEKDFVCVKK